MSDDRRNSVEERYVDMNVTRWLWGLWAAMIVSMVLRQTIDTYMVVALIIIPILIVLLDLHEEIADLKEENKHQRKFVLDRYNLMQERLNDAFNQIEKRMVVDFAEMSKSSESDQQYQSNNQSGYIPPERRKPRKLKKRRRSSYSDPQPFDSEYKGEDQVFAEEHFGGGPKKEIVLDLDFDQAAYDEQVLNQPADEYEEDMAVESKKEE